MSRARLRNAGPASVGAGLALLAAVTLTGCDTVTLVNALTPSGAYALRDGIRYGAESRQRMDLYIPTVTPYRQTVIVFVYGGAWTSGAREQYRFVGQAFSELGYVTVIPDHRLYPDVAYPAFVDDVAGAMAAIPPLLADLSCSRDWRYVVAGHSSGAHTAALLATDPGYLAERSPSVRAAALVGLAGPYDLPLDDPLVKGKFNDRPSDAAVKPVRLAGPDSPPALLLHGGGDETVHPLHTRRLAAALSDAGVDVTATIYPDVDHRTLVGALAKPLRVLAPTQQDIETFLREQDLDGSCGPGDP
jgi:acetyl esterase/lipase